MERLRPGPIWAWAFHASEAFAAPEPAQRVRLFFRYPAFRFASSGINRETYQRLLLRNGARGNVQEDVAMLRLYVHDLAPAQSGQVAEQFCGP